MPFYYADTVSVKGDLILGNVQIYPGVGGQQGQPWRFNLVKNRNLQTVSSQF